MYPSIVKILIPATLSFIIGIIATPVVTHYLYKYKVWKKVGGKTAIDGKTAHEFNRLHGEDEAKTPRMGGIVIWASVIITTLGFTLLARLMPQSNAPAFDFLTRSETWIPFFTLVIGALVGFLNDLLDISLKGKRIGAAAAFDRRRIPLGLYRLVVLCQARGRGD